MWAHHPRAHNGGSFTLHVPCPRCNGLPSLVWSSKTPFHACLTPPLQLHAPLTPAGSRTPHRANLSGCRLHHLPWLAAHTRCWTPSTPVPDPSSRTPDAGRLPRPCLTQAHALPRLARSPATPHRRPQLNAGAPPHHLLRPRVPRPPSKAPDETPNLVKYMH